MLVRLQVHMRIQIHMYLCIYILYAYIIIRIHSKYMLCKCIIVHKFICIHLYEVTYVDMVISVYVDYIILAHRIMYIM